MMRFLSCELLKNDRMVGTSRCDVSPRRPQCAVPTSWEQIDVRRDLFAEFLFAGCYPASAGIARQAGGIDRRTGEETGDHSTERRRGKSRNSKRNDPESSSGAIAGGGN